MLRLGISGLRVSSFGVLCTFFCKYDLCFLYFCSSLITQKEVHILISYYVVVSEQTQILGVLNQNWAKGIQLNKYETAPNFIQLTQKMTSDCLLI